MVPPGPACLVDPSSSASYVGWNPNRNEYPAIYHCIQAARPPTIDSIPAVGSSLRSYRPLPDWCVEAYYTNGSTCNDAQRTKFDVIWTWVNGSDPMIHKSRAKAMTALRKGNNEDDEDGNEEIPEETEEETKKNAHLYT